MRFAHDLARRRWLLGIGATAACAALPFRWRVATAAELNNAPRTALVIGNAKYAHAPLRNPANDARAMAEVLGKLGFKVVAKLDAGRSEMLESIRSYAAEVETRKAVALFYYAGHGAQVAWRNYLIPVDAKIASLDELQAQALDLSALLKNLTLARNPMNVVVLDACRDNPLGDVRLEHKGLSQFDAPPGTLLAYATAPGNVAADGDAEHGLYTGQLLKEIAAPGTKIEDVFKRVRLDVRRASRGQQIPWESTSLEQDFYFQPPRELRKLSEDEIDRAFEIELAMWERIKDAKEPAPLENYLRSYPSGVFSEVAQLKLERVLASLGESPVLPVSRDDNPFSKGTGRVNIRFKVGDRFQYRESDLDAGTTRDYTLRVTQIVDDEVIFNNGSVSSDLLGNGRKESNGDRMTQQQRYIPEYAVGKKWTTRYKLIKPDGREFKGEWDFKVLTREPITVGAGTFNAFRVEGHGYGEDSGATLYVQYWMAPEVGRFLLRESKRINRKRVVTRNQRTELLSYTQS